MDLNKTPQSTCWYEDKKFDRFWSMYKIMMNSHNNSIMYCSNLEKSTNNLLQNMITPNFSNVKNIKNESLACQNKYGKQRSKSKRSTKRKHRKEKKLKRYSTNIEKLREDAELLPQQIEESMQLDDNEDIEVDEDYLKFVEVTDKHHKEWKSQQNKANNDIIPTHAVTIPKEHPDVVRSREMKLLYGENAPRIHAMETAVQLSFDRISTLHCPKHWPEIPLKPLFS